MGTAAREFVRENILLRSFFFAPVWMNEGFLYRRRRE
jgi:hypothetical protein